MLVKKPFNFRSFVVAINTFEVFLLNASVPWAMIAYTIQSQILFRYGKP
jgi:hypothetical protein